MTHHQTATVADWRGRELVGNDGNRIGTIDEVYVDASTEQPEWLSVKTGRMGSKVSFVPIAQAQENGDEIQVPYEKTQVKDAPKMDPDGELSRDEEDQLYRHYGFESGGTGGTGGAGRELDDSNSFKGKLAHKCRWGVGVSE